MLRWVNAELPEGKPRHLLGIGRLDDIIPIIKEGVDTFDCTIPTHYARRGFAFTSTGRIDMAKPKFFASAGLKPLDKNCGCEVCRNYSRMYISHLIRAKEITGLKLLTMHNLYFFNSFVENVRKKIKRGEI